MTLSSFKMNVSVIPFAILMLIILYCDIRFSFARQGWMTITALAMTQFTKGTCIRQTLLRGLTIVAALSVIELSQFLDVLLLLPILLCVSLFTACITIFWFEMRRLPEFALFVFCLLFANFMTTDISLHEQILDVAIVAVVMLCAAFIDTWFMIKKTFIALIVRYLDYFVSITRKLCVMSASAQMAAFSFNNRLRQDAAWVFALGLSPRLRAGFRYYLLEIERVEELFASIATHMHLIHFDNQLSASFMQVMLTNEKLLLALRTFFTDGIFVRNQQDWVQDLVVFEALLERQFPIALQYMHFQHHDLVVVAFLKDCKELRQILFNLFMALPNAK